jgi:hypothetical protein
VAKENDDEPRSRAAPLRRSLGSRGDIGGDRDVDNAGDDDDHDVGGYEGEGIVADDEY